MKNLHSIVMLGATGAVGSQVVKRLSAMAHIDCLSLLGRRPLENITDDFISQHTIDIFEPSSYQHLLVGHQTAICTLGVGQPSKISKAQFLKVDKTAVLDFANACRQAGVKHFQLLCSVGANDQSRSFYLRTKGELESGLKALGFEQLSLFQPSMIFTPTNRYGFTQGLTLRLWPLLNFILLGPLRKYRGIKVELLGKAIANNILIDQAGVKILHWDEFISLAG